MTTKVVLEYSNDKARTIKWLLSKRYGARKSLATMIKLAAAEIVMQEAEKVVGESKKQWKEAE